MHDARGTPASFWALVDRRVTEQLARYDRGQRPALPVRADPELFRAFAARQFDPTSPGFRLCARELGLSAHPFMIENMTPGERRRLAERTREHAAARLAWAERRRTDNAHLERWGYDPETARALRADTQRQVNSARVEMVAILRACALRPTPNPTIERQPRHRPRGAGRRAVRGSSRRSSARSGDSGDGDSEPPALARRLCACGCGRDISHKRAGAQTFDQSCRKRLSRGVPYARTAEEPPRRRVGWTHLADEIVAVEDRIEELLEERHDAWRRAAREGGRRFLTANLAEELQERFLERSRLLARYRSEAQAAKTCGCTRGLTIVEDGGPHCVMCGRGTGTRVVARSEAERVMLTSGVRARRRTPPREWATSRAPAAVA